MSMSFEELYKKSTDDSVFERKTSFSGENDSRFWKPTVHKDKSAKAIIRFLPPPNGEMPFVCYYSYSFQKNNKWYIENSPSTLNNPCPAREYEQSIWDTKDDALIQDMRDSQMTRRTNYVANVYVVSDEDNPEAEGKVFLYRFGQAIMNKIIAARKVEFDDDIPVDAFSMADGANFRLVLKKPESKSKFPTYDMSSFGRNEAFMDGDFEKAKSVWEQTYSLDEFIDPENFKDYDVLKERFDEVVLNMSTSTRTVEEILEHEEEDVSKYVKEEDVDETFTVPEKVTDDVVDDEIAKLLADIEDEIPY